MHSNLNSKTCGTAILIHKKIQFSVTTVTSDPQGRFVMVSGLLYHKPVILINIYTPNWDDDDGENDFINSKFGLTTIDIWWRFKLCNKSSIRQFQF